MKVLLVRLSSMGDLIHTLPAVEDLARMRPDIELHWLSEASFSDIARLHPFVKKVYTMRWRFWRKNLTSCQTWQEMKALKTALQQEQFDLVLDGQGLLKSAVFAKLAAAPIAGLDKQSAREPFAAHFYQQCFAVPKERSAVWRNRALFERAFAYEMPQPQRFGLSVPETGILNNLKQPYVVALHATSRDSKLWPVEYWRELLQKLHDSGGLSVYLLWGSEKEKRRAHQIAENLSFAKVCEKINLLQAAYILQHADGIVGVDTGLLHLANALEKPVVGIYTDTDPVKTGVQESAWAKNLGGVKQIPSVGEVYQTLKTCISGYQDNHAV